MKRRIFSLVVTLVVAISVVLGVSLTANAAEGDGLKDSAISLAENVTLKMEVAIAAPTAGAYAKITLPGNKVDATQLVAAAPKSGDNYVFYAEVAVKDLAKDVTIEICNADGTTLVAEATTSALAYCEKYLAQDGENEFYGLVTALMDYAYAADYYFDPAKTAVAAATPDFTGVADAAFDPAKLPEGITHRSATLLLESETTIRHYFELAEGKYVENYTFFVDLDKDGKADANEVLTPDSKTASDGKTVYYVDIAGLTPNMLDEVYTVGVTGKADGKTYTCDYGALTYLKRAANGDNDAKNLAATILNYNTEAAQLKRTITFNENGGSTVTNQTYDYGVAKPIVAPTAKDGAIFLGWADANGNVVTTVPANATGDVALTAKWYKAEKFAQADFATAGFTVGGPFNVNKGVALYEYFFEDGERYTNEITLSFDILWADFTAEESLTDQDAGYFRFVDSTGLKNTVFFNITKQGVISETGDTLSKTEPTNIRLVMDASSVVYGDGVADKIAISYYVGGVYKTTKTITLSAGDISNYNGSLADYREIFAQYRSTVKSDAKITNLTITDTAAKHAAVSPDGVVATYTYGTATKLPTPTKDGYEFAGWFADEALTQPIDEIPANAVGEFKVYAKWNEIQYSIETFKTGFTADGAELINKGVALHKYFFENEKLVTKEITLSFDILWADYTAQHHAASGRTMFRFIDQDGGNVSFFAINDSGVIDETGDTLSKTEATNIKLVMDASAFVYGDNVADKVSISYYVGGVYKTTKTVTLTKDISQFGGVATNGSAAGHREIFAGFWSNVTAADAKITNLTITNTGK